MKGSRNPLRLLVLLIALSTLSLACDEAFDSPCHPGDMRCAGSKSEMCSADENWETFENCDYYGGGSTCTENCAYADIACCT